jgi:hypothetical protein
VSQQTTEKLDIDAIVRGFARLLSKSWPDVQEIAHLVGTGSYVQDWVQANWEMFVEGALPPGKVFLEVYGEGADCNAGSSRVYRPQAIATHAVMCVPRTGEAEVIDVLSNSPFRLRLNGLWLEEFVSMEGTWFTAKPPFDCVLVDDDGQERVIRSDAVVFRLGEVGRP